MADTETRAQLLLEYFLNRDDIVAVNPGGNWNKPLPVKGDKYLDALVHSHLTGTSAPIHYTNRHGKTQVTKGKVRLGFYTPIPDGTTRWGCLDFDGKGHADALKNPEEAVVKAQQKATDLNIRTYIERSGGGHGFHLWAFFSEPTPAKQARSLLLKIAPGKTPLINGGHANPGRNKGIEVFPKQKGPLKARGKNKRPPLGNLVWLPFWSEAPDGANLFYESEYDRLVAFEPDGFETVSKEKVDSLCQPVNSPVSDTPIDKSSRVKVDGDASASLPNDNLGGIGDESSADWRDWREKALTALDLEAVYAEWLTGESSGDGWLQCRDPDSKSGDRNPSAGVADGTGDANRGTFHSFRTGKNISVFDFLQQIGLAASFGDAVKIIADLSGVPLPGKKEKNKGKSPKAKSGGSKPSKPSSSFPSIVVNNRQMRSIVFDTWGVLLAANARSPQTFLRSGKLVRVNFLTKPPRIDTIDWVYMHGRLMRMADWVRTTDQGTFDALPPRDVSRDMVSAPDGSLPILEIVTSIPVFAPDGELLDAPGYHEKAATWHVPAPDLKIPALPKQPNVSEINQARSILLDDLLVDFPFEGNADLAHVIAAMLLPFVRCMIDSPSPLHVVEAPEAGTGKGLLSDVISAVITGTSASITTLPSQEDEIRKKITTLLSTGRDVILWDNVSGMVASSSLAAALTSRQWEDRKLGESVSLNVPNNCLWLLTGNNPRLSKEIARRSIRIRLDSGLENPADRPTKGFKHPELLSWVQQNRSRLIWSLLILVRAWLAAGSPDSNGRSFGSYESWAKVIGGILQTAQIPGFLGNIEKLREQADIESSELRAFIEEWYRQWESTEVKPGDLNDLCERESMLLAQRGDKGERSQVIRLGKLLGSIKERIFGGLRVKCHKGRLGLLYYLEKSVTAKSTTTSQGELPLDNFDLADLPDEEA